MKVLLIEDDLDITEFVSLAFQVGWPEVDLVSTRLGEEGVALVEKQSPDLVLLDLGLPDVTGFEVLKQIRLFSAVPLIILTVRAEENDIVRGLEWGADEYVTKPFGQMELLARIKATLRRRNPRGDPGGFASGPFRFGRDPRNVQYGKREVRVTTTEGVILRHLARNAGQVVPYSCLSEEVWGENHLGGTDALKVYIRRLRLKFEDDPDNPELIQTRTGTGYVLARTS